MHYCHKTLFITEGQKLPIIKYISDKMETHGIQLQRYDIIGNAFPNTSTDADKKPSGHHDLRYELITDLHISRRVLLEESRMNEQDETT